MEETNVSYFPSYTFMSTEQNGVFISHQVVISIKQYNIWYILDLKPVIQNVLNNKPLLLLYIGKIIVMSIKFIIVNIIITCINKIYIDIKIRFIISSLSSFSLSFHV